MAEKTAKYRQEIQQVSHILISLKDLLAGMEFCTGWRGAPEIEPRSSSAGRNVCGLVAGPVAYDYMTTSWMLLFGTIEPVLFGSFWDLDFPF